jgi:CMP-N-acetylneuraminic acid synthetase/quercetin dioxygenase-like cupin family protein
MKIVAMIPARIGSKRVPKKNLRLLMGKPLISYSIEAAIESGVFDEIYINTDSDEFTEIARMHNVKFYKRPEHLGSDETNNDQFAEDFMKNVESDIVIQLLPTSPLISPEEIANFVDKMISDKLETLISVESKQIACLYEKNEVNFSFMESHRSSQTMEPVYAYATVLMGWNTDVFKNNMQEFGFAYHGANSKKDFFVLKGLSTIDIDNEEDFHLAEVAMNYSRTKKDKPPQFWNKNETEEVDVPQILKKDGIMVSNFDEENQMISKVEEIINKNDNNASWCHRVVNTENNSATIISQMPGEGNRMHHHPDWNEWWYILGGEWEWEIEGKTHKVKKGDIVFIEKNKKHKITATGKGPAIRLAISREDVAHIYT